MKKLFYRLAVCLCVIGGLVGCSKDDEPGGGEGAMYQVTVQQSGDYRSYIKSVVVAANGTTVVNENTGDKFKGTAILDDDALAVPSVTLSTEGSAIEFAVSGGVVDGDDAVVNEPMQWVVIVRKNGKEIDRKTLTFEDGKQISADDLNLYCTINKDMCIVKVLWSTLLQGIFSFWAFPFRSGFPLQVLAGLWALPCNP